MYTDGMFMRIDYNLDEMGVIPEPHYWVFPDELFYPGVNFIDEMPELIIIKEHLEEEYPGMKVFYGIETESDTDAKANEVMLCAISCPPDETEYLQYICTPFGTYTMLYFEENNGRIVEVDPVVLTDELKEILWLRPCEVNDDDDQHCYATYVGKKPTSQFPPLKPNEYLYGSEAWREAVEYWEQHADALEPEDEEPYVDEDSGVLVFTNQEAAMRYINEVVLTAEDDDEELPAMIACIDQPEFHDYVIRIA